ncbi:MAG: hypothetical protein WA439_21370, partial [Pseudolabrys sp.]
SQTNTLEGFAEWNSGTAPVIERSAQGPLWVQADIGTSLCDVRSPQNSVREVENRPGFMGGI